MTIVVLLVGTKVCACSVKVADLSYGDCCMKTVPGKKKSKACVIAENMIEKNKEKSLICIAYLNLTAV